MGCGSSLDNPDEQNTNNKGPATSSPNPKKVESKPVSSGKNSAPEAPVNNKDSGGEEKVKVGGSELNKLLADQPPLFCEVKVKDKGKYSATCVPRPDGRALEFGARSPTGEVYAFEMSDAQLTAQAKNIAWPAFMDNLRTAFCGSIKIDVAAVATIQFRLSTQPTSNFQVALKSTKDKSAIIRLFCTPLFVFFEKRKGAGNESVMVKIEADLNLKRSKVAVFKDKLSGVEQQLAPLREKSAAHDAKMSKLNDQVDSLQKRLNRLKKPTGGAHDPCNTPGPERFMLHTNFASGHTPKFIPPNNAALALLRKRYAEANKEAHIPVAPSDVELQKFLAAAPNHLHDNLLKCLETIETWNFDMFEIAKNSNGGALFITTYCLFYKHGLIGHFDIDETALVNFIGALEAGYHPNAYHNSTHAADVLQCLNYIMGPGGMIKALSMTQEDIMACVIAGAMHDYDHPGFNNNFHCRTNAYLATLYNDRSVLENHHCAQVFEMLRHKKYDIFSNMSDEQKKDVRDTVLEMVLSTDMGLHAKIFQQFRRKLNDDPDWQRKEDVRLALSIGIKMSDISNCARADKLYQEWAVRIADEFYNQGDVEFKLKFTISPFMDRRKHKQDFPKGQISFMNYIVIPLFEAGAEFLPDLEFSVNLIQQNKEYWQNMPSSDE